MKTAIAIAAAGLVFGATISCAFATGQRTPHAFCPAPDRLVLPGELLDSATVMGRNERVLGKIPVFTSDSICVRARHPSPLGPRRPDVESPSDGTSTIAPRAPFVGQPGLPTIVRS